MKITGVKTVVVNAQMRNWVSVKVETDEPGLWGWGEASLEWETRAVAGAVEHSGLWRGKILRGSSLCIEGCTAPRSGAPGWG